MDILSERHDVRQSTCHCCQSSSFCFRLQLSASVMVTYDNRSSFITALHSTGVLFHAGKPDSLHKYGIMPSAFAVSIVSMASTLVSIRAMRASLLISLEMRARDFGRWRLSNHLPIHSCLFWDKQAFPFSPHRKTPAKCLLYLIIEWNAQMSWKCEQIHRQPHSVVKTWGGSPQGFLPNRIAVWNCQNAWQNFFYIKSATQAGKGLMTKVFF